MKLTLKIYCLRLYLKFYSIFFSNLNSETIIKLKIIHEMNLTQKTLKTKLKLITKLKTEMKLINYNKMTTYACKNCLNIIAWNSQNIMLL